MTGAFDWAALDARRPAQPDPQVWADNLHALRQTQPSLAEAVQTAALPDHWQFVHTLEDRIDVRTEPPGGEPAWLGGSAAPGVIAEANIGAYDLADRNVALPDIGAGVELELLLTRLPRHVAIFVFVARLEALAATLRIRPLAAQIAAKRCWFLCNEDAQQSLRTLLTEFPGLLPPATLLPGRVSAPERIAALRTACEAVHAALGPARAAAAEALPSPAARPLPDAPRLAILAQTPGRSADVLPKLLADAAAALGWPARTIAATEPLCIHPLAHAQALAEFNADLCLTIHQPPAGIPPALLRHVAVWVTALDAVPGVGGRGGAVHWLAADPAIEAALRATAAAERVIPFYWAAPQQALRSEAPPPAGRDIVVFGDLPDSSPAAAGMVQPTHRELWEQVRREAQQVWDAGQQVTTEALLGRAERALGLDLTEPELRAAFLRAAGLSLIPHVALRRICGIAVQEGLRAQVVGRGWQQLDDPPVAQLAEDELAVQAQPPGLHPRLAVFLWPRAIGPALPVAAALGWPIAIWAPAGQRVAIPAALLPATCKPSTFQEAAELRRMLRRPPVARRPEEAGCRTWLWTQRLAELLRGIRQ